MTYVYDSNGNIVSKTPYTNVTSSDLSTATQGTAIVYGYGDSNWSDKLTSYDGQTITYDASGNPTSYRGETVTWNGRLMTSFTKDDRRYEYSYNSDGMRTVKKVYKNNELVYTYTYIWDGDVLLGGRMEVTDADEPITIRYLYDDSGELYGMDYNGNGYYGFIKNLQGDIVSIVPLDSESNVELNIEYDAWGKPIFEESSLGAAFVKAMIMAATNVGYRGYFYDFETGLYYLRSRYYDPETGRFINADDTDYLGYTCTSLGMNLFSYCENNPVNTLDYHGFQPRVTAWITKLAKRTPAYKWFRKITQDNTHSKFFNTFDFYMDKEGIYHTNFDCWQAYFGYVDLYDWIFDIATDMENKKYEFRYLNQNYIIWAWKGDYLNLGAGAEVGIYRSVIKKGKLIWKVDKSLAMEMNLVVYYKKGFTSVEQFTDNDVIIGYAPTEKQWWITGFNPKYQDVKSRDLYVMSCLTFDNEDIYNAFAKAIKNDPQYRRDWTLWNEHKMALVHF